MEGSRQRSCLEWLAGAETDALGAELQRVGWVGHILVVIIFMDNLYFFKASGAHGADQLCIQQSPGNSTRPQRYIFHRVGGYRALDQYIPDLQSPARLEDAEPLAQRLGFVQCKVEHAVADHHICKVVRQR